MKKLLFSIPFLITLFSQAQTEIKCVVGDEHVLVPGTHTYIVPPAGYTAASSFIGFQQIGSSSSLMINEMPAPIKEILPALTAPALETQGVVVRNITDIAFNGYQGKLVEAEQFAYGTMFTKDILAYGDETFTLFAFGMCPKELPELRDDQLASLKSMVYDESASIDPEEAAPYAIDVSGTKFEFANGTMGALSYTVGGHFPSKGPDRSVVMAGSSMGEAQFGDDHKLYAINRMKLYPTVTNINPDDVKEVTIDGLKGYEILSYGKTTKPARMSCCFKLCCFLSSFITQW